MALWDPDSANLRIPGTSSVPGADQSTAGAPKNWWEHASGALQQVSPEYRRFVNPNVPMAPQPGQKQILSHEQEARLKAQQDAANQKPDPGQAQYEEYMRILNGQLQQQLNSQPMQQDLDAAKGYARQAAAGRGLSGGIAAGLETRGQNDVHTAFARERSNNIRALLGMGIQSNFQNMGLNMQQRQFMMALAQAAAQGNAEAEQQLWSIVGGLGGGLIGGALGMAGGPGGAIAGAGLGYQMGSGLGVASYGALAPQPTLGQYYK